MWLHFWVTGALGLVMPTGNKSTEELWVPGPKLGHLPTVSLRTEWLPESHPLNTCMMLLRSREAFVCRAVPDFRGNMLDWNEPPLEITDPQWWWAAGRGWLLQLGTEGS